MCTPRIADSAGSYPVTLALQYGDDQSRYKEKKRSIETASNLHRVGEITRKGDFGPSRTCSVLIQFSMSSADVNICRKSCGADRDRTDDLRLAKPALSQLSYGPEKQ